MGQEGAEVSYSPHAYVVIGVLVDTKNLFTIVTVPNCPHSFDTPFCPDCGKPKGTHEEKQYACRDGNGKRMSEEEYFGDIGLDVVRDDSDGYFVVGHQLSDVSQYAKWRMFGFDFEESKTEIKNILEPDASGVWDEKKFGLYHLFYESH